MRLKLDRPIVFFDLETTGIDVAKDHIVELCYIKLFPDGSEQSKVIRLRPTDSLGNTIHIPESTTKIHGITDDDIKDCPTFKDMADDLEAVFADADLAGYNSNHFDIPMLVEEFLRIGKNLNMNGKRCIDACVIYKKMEPRTLSAAYKFYVNRELENAHSALADTRATVDVLMAQLDVYAGSLKGDVESLAQFSTTNHNIDFAGRIVADEKGEAIFNFGKYKGQRVKDVLKKDTGYYNWMLQGDFPLNTKQVIKKLKIEN